MKKYFYVLLCVLLIASLAACNTQANATEKQENENVPVVSEEVASGDVEIVDPLDQAIPTSGERLIVADAKLMRGTVEEFAVNDQGQTVLQLRRAVGTAYDKNLSVVITDDTKQSPENSELANGTFIEVYYGTSTNPDGSVNAIAINNLIAEDMTNYNGTLVSITPDPEKEGSGQMLLDPIDATNGMQYAFNYDSTTQFRLDVNALKPGDKLNVLHSPAATRSIPPQSSAWEISNYQEPEEGELPEVAPEN